MDQRPVGVRTGATIATGPVGLGDPDAFMRDESGQNVPGPWAQGLPDDLVQLGVDNASGIWIDGRPAAVTQSLRATGAGVDSSLLLVGVLLALVLLR